MALQQKQALLASDPVLSEMVSRLVAEFHPDKIYLFGSRAAGTATAESDYDILVVMPELNGPGRQLSVRAYELLSDLRGAKDILFTAREKFEKRKSVMNTLAEIATTDGTELYAA
jgi:predicted nucleotidyltransferase